jgi:two-component system LytT family response regulator
MIRTILIDDEDSSIQVLKTLINKYFNFIEIVGTANSVKNSKKLILEQSPDLIFLDIEMTDGTGFDLLDTVPTEKFKVIFITAYSEYTLKAIKKRAFDYLLKPIDIDELESTIFQVQKEIQKPRTKSVKYPSKINIPYKSGSAYLDTSSIIRLEAHGSYSKIHISDNEEFLVSNNLKHFENKLNPANFFRCHHSHIVNLSKVKRVINEMGTMAILEDGSHIDISKRKKNEFFRRMEMNIS